MPAPGKSLGARRAALTERQWASRACAARHPPFSLESQTRRRQSGTLWSGWNRFGSFSAAGGGLHPADPIWISLIRVLLGLESPDSGVGKAWISLDSLVRNEPYQRVSWISDEKIFALAVPALSRAGTGCRAASDCGKAELFMRMSLALFPLFRKPLSAFIAMPVGLVSCVAGSGRPGRAMPGQEGGDRSINRYRRKNI